MSEKKYTVIEEFEKKLSDIADDFCTNYCKYYLQMDEECDCGHIDDCPLSQIITC